MSLQNVFALSVVGLALSGLACDPSPPSGPVPVFPVAGRVVMGGEGVPNALVVFHPATPPASKPGDPGSSGPPMPTGRTDAEGAFRLHTYVGDDGAPIGDYRVTIVAAGSSEMRDVMAKAAVKGPKAPIPAAYASAGSSGLTAKVEGRPNALEPFELRSSAPPRSAPATPRD